MQTRERSRRSSLDGTRTSPTCNSAGLQTGRSCAPLASNRLRLEVRRGHGVLPKPFVQHSSGGLDVSRHAARGAQIMVETQRLAPRVHGVPCQQRGHAWPLILAELDRAPEFSRTHPRPPLAWFVSFALA